MNELGVAQHLHQIGQRLLDDVTRHGEFRTKRLILERYEAIADAVASNEPYVTVLDPPPADPSVSHRAAATA